MIRKINNLVVSAIVGVSSSTSAATIQHGAPSSREVVVQDDGLITTASAAAANSEGRSSFHGGSGLMRGLQRRILSSDEVEAIGKAHSIHDVKVNSPDRTQYGIVVDHDAETIAIGGHAQAGFYGVAIGNGAQSLGYASLAISDGSRALGLGSIAIGVAAQTKAGASGSVAIGQGSFTGEAEDVAIGSRASATGHARPSEPTTPTKKVSAALAFGAHAIAQGDGAIAFGANSKASLSNATALGAGADAIDNGTALGAGSDAIANGTALGAGAYAGAKSSSAVGKSAKAIEYRAVALGADSFADRPNTVSVGRVGSERQVVNVAAGSRATDAVNVRQLEDLGASFNKSGGATNAFVAYNDNQNNLIKLRGAAGSRLTNLSAGAVEANSSDAVNGAQLFQTNKNVLDVKTTVDTLAKGGAGKFFSANSARSPAQAMGLDALAMGAEASAAGTSAIAVGIHARAVSDNSVALGSNSVADRRNTVSVGSRSVRRQITNVADGTEDTDAVNVSQLREAGLIDKKGRTLDAIVYDPGTNRSSVTLGGVGAASAVALTNVAAGRIGADSTEAVNGSQLFALSSRVEKLETPAPHPAPVPDDRHPVPIVALDGGNKVVAHVAAGVADSDAVNLGQLNAAMKAGLENANAHTDTAVARVRLDMEHDRKDASAGSASAIAIANLPQAYPGESMLSVAGGTFDGQSSVALGVSTATRKWSVKVSLTANTRGTYGGGAGAGYRF
ncbi:YadA-like family protein [Caballeronia sp. LZ035]|uniref:YadA-like family protein n=1 Tax=Caballeronia sp. LZ035 TaxID=3038568 RepID=UPI002854C1EA|nr:YadA-like family protein [Caballeronia sp. LZ035]MDR5755610.1 YadA-like family protein [Caballeronia sp. LZ035]